MYIFPGSRLLSQLMNAMLAVKTKTTIVAIFFIMINTLLFLNSTPAD
jgi:hypothetical protein